MNKKYTPMLLGAVLFGVGVVSTAFVFAEQTRTESVQLFGKENAKVIYSEKSQNGGGYKLSALVYGFIKKDNQLREDQNIMSQKVFLSPDRKYLAITTEPNEETILTYITDTDGSIVVPPRVGYFISWSPDSKKVLLFLSDIGTGSENGRRIYYFDTAGKYENSGLPEGVTSADISSKDGSIVYVVTEPRTDKSNLYIRDAQGVDRLLLKGENNIFAWVRWSPGGDKIAFMKSDLYLNGSKNELWIINPDGNNGGSISAINWNYPPTWSPDGQKLVFSDGVNILEYNIQQKETEQITNFENKFVKSPTYSADGQTVVFSDGKQIWSVRDEIAVQLTEGDQAKDYPILP